MRADVHQILMCIDEGCNVILVAPYRSTSDYILPWEALIEELKVRYIAYYRIPLGYILKVLLPQPLFVGIKGSGWTIEDMGLIPPDVRIVISDEFEESTDSPWHAKYLESWRELQEELEEGKGAYSKEWAEKGKEI